MTRFSDGRPITSLHIEIAKELFKWIEQQRSREDARPIKYGELAAPLCINPQNLRTYLGDLSTECHSLGLPLISAIVVNSDSMIPGLGFYEMAMGLGITNIDVEQEMNRVFRHLHWDDLKYRLGLMTTRTQPRP